MQKRKKIFVFLMSLVLLLSVGNYSSIMTKAQGQTNHKLTVRLTGAGKVRILSENTNVAKKTVRVAAVDRVTFSNEKNNNMKSVTYRSSNKKVLTISKKGKASIKQNGTARITVTVKRKNGKTVTGWVKLRVTGQNPSENQPAGNDSQNPSGNGGQNPSVQQPDGNTTAGAGEFHLTNKTVTLNNGIDMPILGIGTYRLSDTQAENSVYWALRDGYRLIDTARIYGNEAGVGRGIKRAVDEGIVSREDIFVTTKMWTSDYRDGDSAVDASLRRLGLDYIDLMILHHSQPGSDVQAYQAMERAVNEGKLRSIGLSNYYTPEDFDRLVNATTITPALLQNETHPYHQSIRMKEHLKQYGTVMESWYPLGGRGNTQTLFNDPVISSIADAHGKTSAQVILRWHLQAGNIAIPGSSNEAHIQENFEIFDFALTDAEMERMSGLEQNERFSDY